jgi:hypothetical protein
MTDFMLLAQFFRWSIYGKSWRFAIAITSFYFVRWFLSVSI